MTCFSLVSAMTCFSSALRPHSPLRPADRGRGWEFRIRLAVIEYARTHHANGSAIGDHTAHELGVYQARHYQFADPSPRKASCTEGLIHLRPHTLFFFEGRMYLRSDVPGAALWVCWPLAARNGWSAEWWRTRRLSLASPPAPPPPPRYFRFLLAAWYTDTLSLSLTHTQHTQQHTHTHIHRERGREGGRERERDTHTLNTAAAAVATGGTKQKGSTDKIDWKITQLSRLRGIQGRLCIYQVSKCQRCEALRQTTIN